MTILPHDADVLAVFIHLVIGPRAAHASVTMERDMPDHEEPPVRRTPARSRHGRIDSVLAAAVDAARAAAEADGGDAVGEHLGVDEVDERVATHRFAASLPGYRGWYWAVTVTRAPRAKQVTVDEVVLLPGPEALLAPSWVPWSERLQPGDLGVGDLLPSPQDDPRLVPAYADCGDPEAEEVAFHLGLGRARVLSREGRLEAAERWYGGDGGPGTPMARQAPGRCGTCGFLVPLGGSLRAGFGVCANEVTPVDGRVVSVEFGCGAHSEATAGLGPAAEPPVQVVVDDGDEFVSV
jgi:Protein of unknown function (DUF3027)